MDGVVLFVAGVVLVIAGMWMTFGGGPALLIGGVICLWLAY